MKANLPIAVLCALFVSLATPPARGELGEAVMRTWTSADGSRTFEGELKTYDESKVSIMRRTDLKTFSLPLDQLSQADQDFVRGLLIDQKRDNSLKDGPFAEDVTGEFVKRTSEEGLNYQFFGGKRFKGTERYPLVIWLHGSGSSGSDNESQMGTATRIFAAEENQESHPCFVLAPQSPSSDLGWKNEVGENLATLIKRLADNLPIDRDRIYMTGLSMGGFGSFYMAGAYPDLFAACTPMAGGGKPDTAAAMKPVAFWVFHGDQDEEVSPEKSKVMVEAIKEAGGNVKFDLLEGKGHVINGDVLAREDYHEWLFSQRKGGGGSGAE